MLFDPSSFPAISDDPRYLPILQSLIPTTDEARETLAESEETINYLKDILDNSPTAAARVIAAQAFAEGAKAEEARDPIANAGVIASLVKFLQTCDDPEGKRQSLRALANLCYDNDLNREKILEIRDAIPGIVSLLQSGNNMLIETTCGALLNISMDNEPVQVEILNAGTLPVLLKLLKVGETLDDEGDRVRLAVTRLLSNLLETDKGVQDLLSLNGLTSLLQILQFHHKTVLNGSPTSMYERSLEILDCLAVVLEAVAENDAIQRAIVSLDLLDILLDFVDHRPTNVPTDLDEGSPTYADIRKTISRVVTLVTMNDTNMTEIPEHPSILTRFKQWMTNGLGTDDITAEDEIRMSGALCIGNLARSDITCNILVTQHGVAEALLSLLRLEVTRVQQGGGELKSTVKVLHAAVGALKNLSLAVANRQILGSMGVIPAVAELLELQGVKPVQQGGIGILKNLCAGDNAANIYRTITGLSPPSDGTLATWPAPSPTDKTPLRSIISLIWNATGDNDTGIRYEGGRLISHLVRGCVSSSALIRSLIDANIVPPLVQIVTGALLTKVRSDVSDDSDELSEDEHHVHFDALPTSRVFPQVQNEGVVALVMLCKVCPDVVGRVARYEALVGALTSILASGLAVEGVVEKKEEAGEGDQFVYPEEVKCNVGVLVRELCGDESFHHRILQTPIKNILQQLRQTPPATPTPTPVESPARATPSASRPFSPPLGRTVTRSAKMLSTKEISENDLMVDKVDVGGKGIREVASEVLCVL